MKLKNLKISRQLYIGLGLILIAFVLLGTFSWHSSNVLWTITDELYDHPTVVRKAVGSMQVEFYKIKLNMNALAISSNEEEIQKNLAEIEVNEADAFQQIDAIYNSYLGPREDIDNLHTAMVKWGAVRDETVRLFREWDISKGVKPKKIFDENDKQEILISGYIDQISNFAINKTEQFYSEATKLKNDNLSKLLIVFIILLFSILIISGVFIKSIVSPLREFTALAKLIRDGDFAVRSKYRSKNELGILSAAFNDMATVVQNQIETKDRIAEISSVMFLQDELQLFCQEVLNIFLKATDSQVGAIYFLDENKSKFEKFYSVGLTENAQASFSVKTREGEFGAVLATKELQRVVDIPFDTKFVFNTVSGAILPKEMITIPILNENEVVAVLSLASIKNYSGSAVGLIKSVLSELTSRIISLLSVRRINFLYKKLQESNTELEAQTIELEMQSDELKEQNIELEMQTKMLDEASKLKSTFLSNMSHELRTPLNSVIALTSVLNRRLKGKVPDEEYSYLDVIERNGKNLLSLVNNILDLSRIEAGREEISLAHFNLKELVSEIVAMLDNQAKEKNVALVNTIPRELSNIISDRTKCRHILQNIIGNAVKFTKEGSVEISAILNGGKLFIDVSDTGIGIEPDKLIYIFDEFRQADETNSRAYGGTGLGLAIAKKYAMLLGGTIEVESTIGVGTSFTIKLPISSKISEVSDAYQLDSSHIYAEPSEKSNCLITQDKTILLVEDSEPAIIQIKDILTEQGYQIDVSRNGREALEQIEKSLPSAIVLDLMMPEIDGFEVLKTIRSVEKTAEIPVLILTAKHITKDEMAFLKTNHIFQLIQKGAISKIELLAAIRTMVFEQTNLEEPIKEEKVIYHPLEKPLILVVEDNPDNMKTTIALLKEHYDTIEATNGQAGIALMKSCNPALVLLDLSLPIMDGFQVFKEIKREETIRHIPVIALTARAMVGDREEILQYGFDGYISKPIDGLIFEKTIGEVLYAK